MAEAKALFVANNGLDSNTCLDKDHPCRTIGKAIQNANSGDKIVVGPGHYTWESESEPGPSSCSFRCVIKVDKQLTIESRDGAAATVIDATGHNVDVVRIEASNVIFGQPHKGFTLTGASGGFSGLVIADGTSGVKVSGNLAIRNSGQGFTFSGSGHVLAGNIASANFFGFSVIGSGHILTGNIASSNSYGFGFSGNGHLLSGNTASANRFTGFIFSGSGHVLTNNTASANGFHGFDVNDGSGYVLTGNSAVGNKFFGIDIRKSASATITKNNIFGNDSQPSGSFVNCGLLNQSRGTINATNNFWGAAAGPGADPADNICNDGMGSNTTVAPFATKEFKAKSQSVPLFEEFTQLVL
ncbi:right-handed parallel beta-helix repeat-containing protein [Candidatus Acetothermia bacterium]|nr:right-handed parallel beta-helix repeat-containing protein [Candidatus Acetothermia bacterium]